MSDLPKNIGCVEELIKVKKGSTNLAFEELEAIVLAKYRHNVFEVQTLQGSYFGIAEYLTKSPAIVAKNNHLIPYSPTPSVPF